MTAIEASFYDGKSSRQRDVLIEVDPTTGLRITGDGIDLNVPLAQVRVSARVGNTRRHLYFADGLQCETDNNDAIDKLFSGVRTLAPARLLHRWESSLRYGLLIAFVTSLLLSAGIIYGVPALAKSISFNLPASTETLLGQQALAGLDTVLEPTKLSPVRQASLRALFSGMASGIKGTGRYRLELRASKRIGANALALPSGIVVVTDSLVELARGDDELIAVFAHEIGHLKQHHTLRQVLQGSATVLFFIAVTGDITSIASLAAQTPTLLVASKYSRDFEREADDFAYDYLKRHGIATDAFTEILLQMEKQAGAAGGVPGFLSSHPSTPERVKRLRSAH